MANKQQSWTLGELAELFKAELIGPSDVKIARPGPADTEDPDALTFAINPKYLGIADASAAAAVLVGPGMASTKPHLIVESPRAVFGAFLAMCHRPLPLAVGIHPTAVVSGDATIDSSASIGAYVVIESGARVGPNARIYPFSFVGENCTVGAHSVLFPHVVLVQDVHIGERTQIHSGTVLGADGFGYVWDGQAQRKVPQVGGVRLGDYVEIGALSAVDRATAGVTSIGNDTKIDNLVQIAHNVRVGQHSIIISQSGVAGSVTLGDRVTLGGQSGVTDHVTISDDVMIGGRSAAGKNISVPGLYMGVPAAPVMQDSRQRVMQRRLPEMLDRLKTLENEIENLKKELNAVQEKSS